MDKLHRTDDGDRLSYRVYLQQLFDVITAVYGCQFAQSWGLRKRSYNSASGVPASGV